jgi:hypothetical protein
MSTNMAPHTMKRNIIVVKRLNKNLIPNFNLILFVGPFLISMSTDTLATER